MNYLRKEIMGIDTIHKITCRRCGSVLFKTRDIMIARLAKPFVSFTLKTKECCGNIKQWYDPHEFILCPKCAKTFIEFINNRPIGEKL